MRINIPKLVKNCVLPATLSIVSPADSSPATLTVPIHSEEQMGFELTGDPTLFRGNFPSFQVEEAALGISATTLRVPIQSKRLEIWDEKRFHSLALKEALGTVTPEEASELEELDRRRSVDQPAIDPETIEARERLLSKIESLIDELNSFGKARRKTA
jgi:hypothetical protein